MTARQLLRSASPGSAAGTSGGGSIGFGRRKAEDGSVDGGFWNIKLNDKLQGKHGDVWSYVDMAAWLQTACPHAYLQMPNDVDMDMRM